VRVVSTIPLKPIGKEDIKKLELALILGTLFREDVIEQIRSAEDKVTWLDSLVVAASALARERAGIPVSRIAEELGRTEATIRNHLGGKTEAGRIVRETYKKLVEKGGELEIEIPGARGVQIPRDKAEKLVELLGKIAETANEAKKVLEELLGRSK